MKYISRIFSVFLSAVLAATGIGFSSPLIRADAKSALKEVSQNTPFQMTVLGDSIAAGYGLEGHERDREPCYQCRSYANILAEKYSLEAGSKYYNDAVSGATSADLLTLLDNESVAKHIKSSDTIIISIGGNDLLHLITDALINASGGDTDISKLTPIQLMSIVKEISEGVPAALEGFEENLVKIMTKLRSVNPQALVIVQTLYNPFESFEQFKELESMSNAALEEFNGIITSNAADKDGNTRYITVDIAGAFKGKALEATNIADMDIHPNAQGHTIIAELLDSEITSHTFTTWIIDNSADESASQAKKQEAVNFTRVMFGLFFILIILVTLLFVHSLQQLKNK